ncbi:MAG: hypothetical protein K0S44_1028 [Bacteroidetes bacterium]|jgi:hypothetical protein|nr:hypothetical protein [Bacteroidota bacterium]
MANLSINLLGLKAKRGLTYFLIEYNLSFFSLERKETKVQGRTTASRFAIFRKTKSKKTEVFAKVFTENVIHIMPTSRPAIPLALLRNLNSIKIKKQIDHIR